MKFIIAFGIICSFLLEINGAEFTDCGKIIFWYIYGMINHLIL